MLEVRVRHINEAESIFLCNVNFGQQYSVIADIKENGGIYLNGLGHFDFNSHQYVANGNKSWFEIIVGDESNDI